MGYKQYINRFEKCQWKWMEFGFDKQFLLDFYIRYVIIDNVCIDKELYRYKLYKSCLEMDLWSVKQCQNLYSSVCLGI